MRVPRSKNIGFTLANTQGLPNLQKLPLYGKFMGKGKTSFQASPADPWVLLPGKEVLGLIQE
jgi:hypothetical protein